MSFGMGILKCLWPDNIFLQVIPSPFQRVHCPLPCVWFWLMIFFFLLIIRIKGKLQSTKWKEQTVVYLLKIHTVLTNQSENWSICTTNYHQGDERTSQLECFLQFTLLWGMGVGNFELFPNACQGSTTVTGAHIPFSFIGMQRKKGTSCYEHSYLIIIIAVSFTIASQVAANIIFLVIVM